MSSSSGAGPVSSNFPRKLSVSWIVEETVSFYRDRFTSVFSIFLMFSLATWSVQSYTGVAVKGVLGQFNLSIAEVAEHPERVGPLGIQIGLRLLAIVVVLAVVLWVLYLLVYGSTIRYTYDTYAMGEASWYESFSKVLPFLPKLFAASIIVGVVVGLGLVLFIVPGVILLLMFVVVPQVIVLEGAGVVESLGRSSRITSGNKTTIFLFILFWMILVMLIDFAVASLVSVRWIPAASLVESAAVGPIIPISTTIIYRALATQPEEPALV